MPQGWTAVPEATAATGWTPVEEKQPTSAPKQQSENGTLSAVTSFAKRLWDAGAENRKNPLYRLGDPNEVLGLVGSGTVAVGARAAGRGVMSKVRDYLAKRGAATPSQEVLNELPLFKQMEHLPTQGSGPVPAGGRIQTPPLGGPSRGLPSEVPKLGTDVPVRGSAKGAAANIKLTKSARIAETDAGADDLEKLLDDLHGPERGNAPNGGLGQEPQSFQQRFNTMMKEKGAVVEKHVASGELATAAAAAEEHAVLSVTELASKMRKQYGSARAGKMLQPNKPAKVGQAAIKRLTPDAPAGRIPDVVRNYEGPLGPDGIPRGESGAINPKVLGSIGGAAAGAAYGGSQGDTSEERIHNAVIGGTIGALTVPTLLSLAAIPGTSNKIQSVLVHAMLLSPRPISKAWLGALGGVSLGAAEHPAAAKGIIATFAREGPALFKEALKSGSKYAVQSAEKTGQPGFLTRIFGAMDAAARNALEKNGISPDDAARYMLSGKPTTVAGTAVLDALNKSFILRYLGSMFPRVAIQQVERSLEHVPGLSSAFPSLKTGGNPVLKQVIGAMTMAGGAATADKVDPAYLPYIAAAGGPIGTLYSAGVAGMKAKPGRGVQAAVNAFGAASPLPQYGADEILSLEGRAAGLVPASVRDFAKMRDTEERDTSTGAFPAPIVGKLDRVAANVPGWREKLPRRAAQVNIAGEPVHDRSSKLTRLLTTNPRAAEPHKGIPEKVTKELTRLGLKINPPAGNPYKDDSLLGKVQIPADILERSRAESRQYLVPDLEKKINSPAYAQADDAKKKRMLEFVRDQASTAASQRARENVKAVLRKRGLLK